MGFVLGRAGVVSAFVLGCLLVSTDTLCGPRQSSGKWCAGSLLEARRLDLLLFAFGSGSAFGSSSDSVRAGERGPDLAFDRCAALSALLPSALVGFRLGGDSGNLRALADNPIERVECEANHLALLRLR